MHKKSRPDIGRLNGWLAFVFVVILEPQEAVTHIVRIRVISRDLPR